MARDERFWHPTRSEWKWLCEVRPELDPRYTLMKKDGSAIAFFLEDKPVEDIERGKKIAEEREEEKRRKQAETLARSEEQAEQDIIRREKARAALVRRQRADAEHGREKYQRSALRKKALTTDDPFEASVLNAVDKDRKSQNSNYIIHAKRLSELPKIALSDPEEIRERVDFYYQLCVTDGVRPNLPGLALAFGLTRTGLMNALADRRMTREAADEIGRGIAMLDEIIAGMTLDGKINPVAAIYFMNNWLGYKNASEVTTRTETVSASVDQKALEQKYQSVVDIE